MRRLPQFCRAVIVALACFAFAAPDPASAQDPAAPTATSPSAGSKWGLGFQSSWPAWGISALYDVSEKVTAQGVIGAFSALTTIGARGLYRFDQKEVYSLYGFGSVGAWSHTGYYSSLLREERETVIGLGAGGGIELDWRGILSSEDGSFPPLFSTLDLGIQFANFEYYNFSALGIGVGLHYRF